MGTIEWIAPQTDLLASLAALPQACQPDTLILLPSRRACRRLEALIATNTHILPHIMPLGDIQEEWLCRMALRAGAKPFQALQAIPAEANALQVCYNLAIALQDAAPSLLTDCPPWTFELAMEAAEAIWQSFEQLDREGVPLERLVSLHAGNMSEHWHHRLELLRFGVHWWRNYQREHACLSPIGRRHALAEWMAHYLPELMQNSTVLLAGSTGSNASTRLLMRAVLNYQAGALWLQDCSTPQPMPSVPQSVITRLLASLEQPLPPASEHPLCNAFVQATPSDLTAGIQILEAQDEREEAQLAALLVKESLIQSPQETVAIVVPAATSLPWIYAALDAEGIPYDTAIADTMNEHPTIRLLQRQLTACASPTDPVAWLAFMKDAQLFANHEGWHQCVQQFEAKAVRGKRDNSAILQRFALFSQKVVLEAEVSHQVQHFCEVMQHMPSSAPERGDVKAIEWATWQWQTLRELGALTDEAPQTVWQEFEQFLAPIGTLSFAAYQLLFSRFFSRKKQFQPTKEMAYVQVYSPIEARLMPARRMILTGLNDGSWPASHLSGHWLHPALYESLGLPDPRADDALQAHDFLFLSASAAEVFWLRARQINNAAQIPSRWLARFVQPDDKSRYVDYLYALKQSGETKHIQPPQPILPPSAFPQKLSLTALEMLLQNPYGFYAKYVLRLKRAEPLRKEADSILRGELIHTILERFTKIMNDGSEINAHTFRKVLDTVLSAYSDPVIQRQWRPRIEQMESPLLEEELQRRSVAQAIMPEEQLSCNMQEVLLEGRADRIEIRPNNTLSIIDYKTGELPNESKISKGFYPQLPLLAEMAQLRFDARVIELGYWEVGKVGKPLEKKPLKADIEKLQQFYRDGLAKLLSRYRSEACVMWAIPQPKAKPTFDDYAILSREAQWQ